MILYKDGQRWCEVTLKQGFINKLYMNLTKPAYMAAILTYMYETERDHM